MPLQQSHFPLFTRKNESRAPLQGDLLLQPILVILPVVLHFRNFFKELVDAITISTRGPALAVRMRLLPAVETARGPDVFHILTHGGSLFHEYSPLSGMRPRCSRFILNPFNLPFFIRWLNSSQLS